jgi:RNA polymerase sigma-70 factor (ECF subfamily)
MKHQSDRPLRSDLELFDTWCEGDRAAGEELIERHFQPIYRFFSNKVAGELEDLVQQTFLRCLEARARFRREASFRTFLFAVARNTLFDHLRRRRGDIDFGVTSLVDLGMSVSSAIVQRERSQLVAQALRQIPLDLQTVLELHYWEELSTAEMAQILEVPQGTIKSRLRRGREALAERLRGALLAEPAEAHVRVVDGWARQLGAEIRASLGE